jgi:hypothetical protein
MTTDVRATTRTAEVNEVTRTAPEREPFYRVLDVGALRVTVYNTPLATPGAPARYGESRTYTPGGTVLVMTAGEPRGGLAVADLFPPESRP